RGFRPYSLQINGTETVNTQPGFGIKGTVKVPARGPGSFPLRSQETAYGRCRRPFFRAVVRTMGIGPRTPPPGRVVSRFAVINPRQSVDYFFAVVGVVGTVISADERVYHAIIVKVAHGPERHIGLFAAQRIDAFLHR